MFKVEIYKELVNRDGSVSPIDWVLASTHSQGEDAEAQVSRFIEAGIDSQNVRIVAEVQPVNAPQEAE